MRCGLQIGDMSREDSKHKRKSFGLSAVGGMVDNGCIRRLKIVLQDKVSRRKPVHLAAYYEQSLILQMTITNIHHC